MASDSFRNRFKDKSTVIGKYGNLDLHDNTRTPEQPQIPQSRPLLSDEKLPFARKIKLSDTDGSVQSYTPYTNNMNVVSEQLWSEPDSEFVVDNNFHAKHLSEDWSRDKPNLGRSRVQAAKSIGGASSPSKASNISARKRTNSNASDAMRSLKSTPVTKKPPSVSLGSNKGSPTKESPQIRSQKVAPRDNKASVGKYQPKHAGVLTLQTDFDPSPNHLNPRVRAIRDRELEKQIKAANVTRAQTLQPQIDTTVSPVQSPQRRPVNFSPYTVKDYRQLGDQKELGGLGPFNIGNEEWVKKKQRIDARKNYSQGLVEKSRHSMQFVQSNLEQQYGHFVKGKYRPGARKLQNSNSSVHIDNHEHTRAIRGTLTQGNSTSEPRGT